MRLTEERVRELLAGDLRRTAMVSGAMGVGRIAEDLAADALSLHAALATERERCARLCDAAAARWRAQRDHDNAERAAGRASNDDAKCAVIIARQNEAAALAAEIRGGGIAGCP